ncbi:MAG: DUF4867 family protein [Selenomonas sp.]|uniref:DUF4867 family protein n=1 Tax=Selenomonas sp. TaxID=2053611 RepID=UPI0025F35DC7|nr:DUF4867 family protein [Selenomonas sp.]MCR5758634.1 DUF4867 family protein [Selenomonas sp.]
MQAITSENFKPYGRILPLDLTEFVDCISKRAAVPAGQVSYEPSVAEFEHLPVFGELSRHVFGDMPVELGHCSGWNHKLNGLEYHRSSEIDMAATDLILLVGRQQDIDWQTFTYDTAKVEGFLVPAGTAVELYATTLHFAPCSVGDREFRMGVALPRGTNEPLDFLPDRSGEDRLLLNKNKWLLAHKESGLEKDGAWIGLTGENLSV